MNVLVTGGAGYIGSICTEELLNAGYQVTVYDDLSEGHRSAVDERARFMYGRPEEKGDLLHAVRETRPDAIMHFAANALVGESMTDPGKYFHNNVANGLKLLDAAVACRPSARFTAQIIPRPTAPASAITFTSATWRRRTSWAWRRGSAASTTWATATATRCAR